MSILTLSTTNFGLVGNQRKALHLNVPGAVLVLFKMKTCPGCTKFMPTFQQLATESRGFRCAVVDVGDHKDVLRMAKQTVNPIAKVPDLRWYVNGTPITRPTKRDIGYLRGFVKSMMQQLSQMSQQVQTPQQPQQPQQVQMPQQFAPQMQSMSSRGSHQQSGRVYRPEGIGNQPLPAIDDDEDVCLLIPELIHPHNKPWETFAPH